MDHDAIRTDQEAKNAEAVRTGENSVELVGTLHAPSPSELHEALLANPEVRLLWLAGHSNDAFYFESNESESIPIGDRCAIRWEVNKASRCNRFEATGTDFWFCG